MCQMLGAGTAQVRLCSAAPEPPVLVEEKGEAKVITLNRPKGLNSLNHEMVQILQKRYNEWPSAEPTSFIVMKGAGGKAFCAGGDIVAVAKETEDSPTKLRRDFFLDEYRLNHTIKTYPQPHIALLDGIVMGGGVGLYAHPLPSPPHPRPHSSSYSSSGLFTVRTVL